MGSHSLGRIAFTRLLPDLGEQVFTMDANGTDVQQLTGPDRGESWAPAWSPDGTRLCFASRRDGHAGLYAMEADGSAERRLTAGEDADEDLPAWSPDAEQIVFSRANRNGADELHVLRLRSGEERRLTTGALDSDPCFSRDGRLIAFRRALTQTPGIHVMPATGGEPWFLLHGSEPCWSPEARWLAYSHGDGIWVALVDEAAGQVEVRARLTDGGDTTDHHPSWSADGKQIVFEREPLPGGGLVSQIVVMQADGSQVTTLGEGRMPDWSPAPA
jgi:TolB protein